MLSTFLLRQDEVLSFSVRDLYHRKEGGSLENKLRRGIKVPMKISLLYPFLVYIPSLQIPTHLEISTSQRHLETPFYSHYFPTHLT